MSQIMNLVVVAFDSPDVFDNVICFQLDAHPLTEVMESFSRVTKSSESSWVVKVAFGNFFIPNYDH